MTKKELEKLEACIGFDFPSDKIHSRYVTWIEQYGKIIEIPLPLRKTKRNITKKRIAKFDLWVLLNRKRD